MLNYFASLDLGGFDPDPFVIVILLLLVAVFVIRVNEPRK